MDKKKLLKLAMLSLVVGKTSTLSAIDRIQFSKKDAASITEESGNKMGWSFSTKVRRNPNVYTAETAMEDESDTDADLSGVQIFIVVGASDSGQ